MIHALAAALFCAVALTRPALAASAPYPAPPPPVRDLAAVSFYSDASYSVVDPAAAERNRTAVRPVHFFLNYLEHLIEAGDGGCALTWMTVWARGGALQGTLTRQALYERDWTLAGLALAWRKLGPIQPGEDRDAVLAWFGRLAAVVEVHYDRRDHIGPISDTANNHSLWAGLAVAAAGLARGDATAVAWGLTKGRAVLARVEFDGALPLELARRDRALHYHLFALTPLMFLDTLARAAGQPYGSEDEAALGRLVGFVQASLADPSGMAARAGGVSQERLNAEDGTLFGWAEPWAARHPSPALAALLVAHRPIRSQWLGGVVQPSGKL